MKHQVMASSFQTLTDLNTYLLCKPQLALGGLSFPLQGSLRAPFIGLSPREIRLRCEANRVLS